MQNSIVQLRHEIHKNPELSGKEVQTSKRIKDFVSQYNPDEIIELESNGIACVFLGTNPDKGKCLVFRAELDALPIEEKGDLDYKSKYPGKAHSCGHDGHMASVVGLASKIHKQKLNKGKVVLLFQPAEETGQGAYEVLNGKNWDRINPDFMFAYHNIPGYPKGEIILKKISFASASKGMTLKLFGKTSHAAEPENGINPSMAISKIIREMDHIINRKDDFERLVLATVVNIHLGEIAFGTSAGYAELRVTLRAFRENDMKKLSNVIENMISKIAQSEKLDHEITYSEVFPATVNDDHCVDILEEQANKLSYNISYRDEPFRWSEDFGFFAKQYPSCFFGIGSGENQPALHNPDFDFPDELIDIASDLFFSVCKHFND